VILANLQSDDRRRKKLALVALKNIQVRDYEIISALNSIADFEDIELLHTVKSLVQGFHNG